MTMDMRAALLISTDKKAEAKAKDIVTVWPKA